MGRRSSVLWDFVHVKTVVGLERFEVGKSRTATTSLPDFVLVIVGLVLETQWPKPNSALMSAGLCKV